MNMYPKKLIPISYKLYSGTQLYSGAQLYVFLIPAKLTCMQTYIVSFLLILDPNTCIVSFLLILDPNMVDLPVDDLWYKQGCYL